MRLYYVVTDTSPTKKSADQRRELIEKMNVRDLESDTPNRTFQFGKVDATGTRWFGGIDLDTPALAKLNERRNEPDTQRKLAGLLQAELRAALTPAERGRFTVQVVASNADPQKASEAAQAWLAANWEYPKDR